MQGHYPARRIGMDVSDICLQQDGFDLALMDQVI